MNQPSPIASQIRDLRKAKKLTLKQLAQRCDLSIGHLSQVERGLSEVSLSALKTIAGALEVQMSWFFQEEEGVTPNPQEAGFIVRATQRRQLKFTGTGISEQLLSPDLKGETLVVMTEIAVGAGDPVDVSRPVEESGVVLAGELELWINEQQFLLKEGDSFRIPKDAPHRCLNPGPQISRTLWVITPPYY